MLPLTLMSGPGKSIQLNALVFLLAEMCIRLQEFVGQMKSAINALCGL